MAVDSPSDAHDAEPDAAGASESGRFRSALPTGYGPKTSTECARWLEAENGRNWSTYLWPAFA